MPENSLHVVSIGIVLLSVPVSVSGGCAFFDRNNLQDQVLAPAIQEVVQPTEVRALPGQLDKVPVFNSNSPEWLKTEGILLSTFPPVGKQVSAAHLNFPFQGRFDLFVQHYTRAPRNSPTLYLGVILHNSSSQPIAVEVLQAASYLLSEVPWQKSAPYTDNSENTVYGAPGDRAVSDVLLGKRQANFPERVVIPADSSQMLLNLPMSVRNLSPPMNGRSTFMRLRSSGKIYVASLTMFAKKNSDGSDQAPTLDEWQALLNKGALVKPRYLTPTSPKATSGQLIYGQVAGVSSGSQWKARLVDRPETDELTLPQPGQAVSYALSTLRGGQFSTNQVQAAPMLVRYPDTAYEAHGNYAVEYDLNLPLHNATNKPQTVTVTLETPIKEDRLLQKGLRFQVPPLKTYFSGTVRLHYQDDQGSSHTRYVHLWHQTGQMLQPLETLVMPPGSRKAVQVDFIYPPDSTPPQVLTIRTKG